MPFPVAFIYWWNYIWSSTHQRSVLVCETTNNFCVSWNPKFFFVQIQERCNFFFILNLVFHIKLATWMKALCVIVRSCLYETCLLYVALQLACVVDTLNFGPLINESFLSKVWEKWMRFHSSWVKQLSVKRIWQTGHCKWRTVGYGI